MSIQIDIATERDVNLFRKFADTADRLPEQIAFKADGGLGKVYTYKQVKDLATRIASGLADPEYHELSEIGLLSENRPEWCIAYLSILAAGRTVVPIDVNLKEAEISFIIEHTGLNGIFCSGKFESFVTAKFPRIQCFSFDESSSQGWLRLSKDPAERSTSGSNATASLIYTSGTTGEPKWVELTHRNLLANLDGINKSLKFSERDVFLSVLPLHHTFEATCGFITPLVSGATIVYARSLKSREILEDIARNKINIMCGVPLLYEKMYHSIHRGIDSAPLVNRTLFRLLLGLSALGWRMGGRWGRSLLKGFREKTGLGTIRMFVSGGAALPSQISRFFNLTGFSFMQGYGMTECSPVISVNRPDNIKFDSVGPPLVNLEVDIFEPGPRGIGEIVVRGDSITPGYRNNPARTSELIRDGWLHTGDLGKFKDGHLWITGRKKNVIVSAAGKNIYPEQIEEKLLESRLILEAVVFGQKRKGKTGEEVCAVIVPDMEQVRTERQQPVKELDPQEIRNLIRGEIDLVNRQMSDYKRISAFDVRLEELEKTSTKKVKRFLYKDVNLPPLGNDQD
ncbi:MAG TPA: AMP-binding protein [candidate division Zixibacteria bacterium]|nr:AMP-binding protein [candidate division Zixibacteria bacterium]